MDVEGRTALVTGASGNIGRAIAVALADGGADVGVSAVSDEAGCTRTAELVREAGQAATVAMADLTEPADVADLVASVRDDLGPLDVLVNNAAIRPVRRLVDISLEEWERVHGVNVRAPYLLSQAVVPDLLASDAGAIVNLHGTVISRGHPSKAHVVSSKLAAVGLTKALAVELGPEGVRVNGVSPGLIDTGRDPAEHRRTIDAVPLRRMGEPEEIAAVCRFLASDAASYVTGQVVHVNGGLIPTFDLKERPVADGG